MDWNKFLSEASGQVISAVIGALFTLVGVGIANRHATQREERERLFREKQAALERQERDRRAKNDAIAKHLQHVLQEMREAEASMEAMYLGIALDNSIVPDMEWQHRFRYEWARFESALGLVPHIQRSGGFPEDRTMHFLQETSGVFRGKTRLMNFNSFQNFMTVAMTKVTGRLQKLYDGIDKDGD